MLIRSQDKKLILNFSNIKYFDFTCYKNKASVFANLVGEAKNIGEYSSEENAIKVLDMICGKYDTIMASRFYGCENDGYEIPIFDMPQDTEV